MNPDLEKRLEGMVLNSSGACIILYKGKQLQLPSGKAVWTKPAYAKNAWNNAFKYGAKGYGYSNARAMRDDLVSKGLLQFKVL